MTGTHQPVLAAEVLSFLGVDPVRRIVDGTVGYGGHAGALLRHLPEATLLGLDRDSDALQGAAEALREFGPRVRLVQARFSALAEALAEAGWERVDAVLLDLGVSSPQIDTPARGFSFRFDGPLDMRMDRRDRVTAATILNTCGEAELAHILADYGEEPKARLLARAIVARRAERPWERTAELAALAEAVLGRRGGRGLPPATRCFQALRIAVNDELGELERGLEAAVGALAPAGRLAVIAFHSLEDRRVKQFVRYEALDCVCLPECPLCICGKVARLRPVTRKPVTATATEISRNPRAASARLRVAERLADGTRRPTWAPR
jgi:16S rRNA (cytosine1402-N4)-methyltransferase